MADYKTMYITLFNSITEVIKTLQNVQSETEELYLKQEEANIVLIEKINILD